MATTNFNLRLEQDLRDRAFPVFERYGLSLSLVFITLAMVGCGENAVKKDYEYFTKNIDDAKRTANVCVQKQDKSDECVAAGKAVIEWRNKIVENHTKATAWD